MHFEWSRNFLLYILSLMGVALVYALVLVIVGSPESEVSANGYQPPPQYITWASYSENYFPRLDELARSIGMEQTTPGGWEVIEVIEAAIEYCGH